MSLTSHSHGATSTPLLEETIGAMLERIVAQHKDREALVECASGQRWTYAELNQDVNAIARGLLALGSVHVSLTFSSDRPATCVFLRICDVAPDGASKNLTDKMMSLPAYEGSPWHVDVDLPPVSAVLAKGHRLRLQVRSGAFPRFLPHSGTDGRQKPRRFPNHQTLHHDTDSPATITVPFVTPTP